MQQIGHNINLAEIKKSLPSTLSDIKKEKVLLAIFAEYSEMILSKGYVNLGKQLGVIYLKPKKATKKRVLNYDLFNKTGKKIYLSNLHSDDIIYTLEWAKGKFHNNKFYKFKGARLLTRALSKILKQREPVIINPKNFVK